MASAGKVEIGVELNAKNAKSDAAKLGKEIESGVKSGTKGAESAVKGISSKFKEAFGKGSESAGTFGSKVSSVMGSASTSIASFAAGAAGALGAAFAVDKLIQFGQESIQVGMNFESAMSQVAATMGVTREEVQELSDFAQEMGATTAFSATEAANALNYMALAGYDAETSMKMLPNVLNLAAAGNIDLASASDMVTDAQSALGLTLDQTTVLVDQMAKASSKSNTSVGQLGEAFLTVGGTAKNLAGGTQEAATALGILADNGVKGAEGGTALRNIILSLSAPTDKAAQSLQQLGIEVFDAEGNMRGLDEIFRDFNDSMDSLTQQEKTEALNNIFNKVDLKSVNALLAGAATNVSAMGEAIANTGVDLKNFSNETYNTGDAATNMAQMISDAMTVFDGDVSKVAESVALELGISMEDATQVVEAAAGAAETAGDRFDELSGYIGDAAGAAQQMADTQLDNLEGDITLLQSAMEGFQISIASGFNPALRSIAQIAGTAFGDLKTAWDESMSADNFVGAGEAIGRAVIDIANSIIEQLPAFMGAAVELINGFALGLVEGLPSLVATFISALLAYIPELIQAFINIFTAVVEAIPVIIQELVAAIPTIITALVEALVKSVTVLVQGFIQLFNAVITALPQIIEAIIPMIPQIVTALCEALIAAMPQLIEAFIQLFVAFVMATPQIIMMLVEMVPTIIGQLVTAIVNMAAQLFAAAITIFVQFVAGIVASIPKILSALGDMASQMLAKVQELPGKMLDVGKNIIDGIWNGISGAIGGLISNIQGACSDIMGAITGFFGIHSPSTLMRDMVGKNLAEGIAVGFNENNPFDDMEGTLSDGVESLESAANALAVEIPVNDESTAETGTETVEAYTAAIEDEALNANESGTHMAEEVTDGMDKGVREADKIGNNTAESYIAEINRADASPAAAKLKDSAMNELRKGESEARQIGNNIGYGMMEGLEATTSAMGAACRAYVRNILDTIKAEGQQGSPWKTTIEIGKYAGEGLVVGFADVNPMAQIASSIRDGLGAIALMSQTQAASAGVNITNNNQNNHFHGKVETPDEFARKMRMYDNHGLAGSYL